MTRDSVPHLLIYAPSARAGGPLRYLEHAVPLIVQAWPGEVTVVSSGDGEGAPMAIEAAGARVIGIGNLGGLGRIRRSLRAHSVARHMTRQMGTVVVFSLGNMAYAGPRVRSVTLVQNALSLRNLRHPSAWVIGYVVVLRLSILVAARRSQRLIVTSSYTKQQLTRTKSKAKAIVVHHGVVANPDKVREGLATPPTGDPPATRQLSVLIAGAILPYKGIEMAISAIARCRSRRLELRLIGDVQDHRYGAFLKLQIQKYGLANRVQWIDSMPQEELLEELAMADIVLISSRAESCPNVLFEACAVRPCRPIVGLAFPWSREYNDLFDVRVSSSNLSGTLGELPMISGPLVSGRRAALLGHYRWELAVADTVQVLREVADA